jgi:5-methylcytosine-specific restriction endonuclease McrA
MLGAANTVRYWRKTSRNGQFQADPEVRYAISIRLAHMLAGGYNSDARRFPLDVRALAIERDRVCVQCGGPGEEIDHIEGDSSNPGNLHLLCKTCHHAKTAEHLVPAGQDESDRIFAMLVERVIPDAPAQLCDDEVSWQVTDRRLRGERIARVRPAPARKLDLSSIEMLPPKAVTLVEDFDEDDDDRDENYYVGFGENSHYLPD